MSHDQMTLLLESFFQTLFTFNRSAHTTVPQDVGIAADLLDDLGRADEAQALREGGTLCRVPSRGKSPAYFIVLVATCRTETYRSGRSIYTVHRSRWLVNGVVVGNSGTQSATIARCIQSSYAIQLSVRNCRLLGRKVLGG